ncbi:hypothetical protein R6Q59_005556 [Mikania micrantha]|uniref:Oleosin n=1 Tax=Mikania micrantha TaxID=192012 RepID=A0A5N6Q218_9ASTR|nr:hypothetical protein E3N88_01820 [Mikania micrantha]
MATTYERQHFATQPHRRHDFTGGKLRHPNQRGSTSKTVAIISLLPVGGILLGLAGITFVGTMIGLAVATPIFVIFSPVVVPAVLTIALAVTGFLASGMFGLTGLSSLSYLFNMVRQSTPSVPEQLDYVKGTIQEVGEYTGQKTKDLGQMIQHAAHEMGDQGQGQAGAHVQVAAGAGAGTGGKEGRKEGGKGTSDRT